MKNTNNYARVNWTKMHNHDYNSCHYCGGRCTDPASAEEWRKARENLALAQRTNDTAKIRYFSAKIDEHLTYVFI